MSSRSLVSALIRWTDARCALTCARSCLADISGGQQTACAGCVPDRFPGSSGGGFGIGRVVRVASMNCMIASAGIRTARPQFTRGSFRRRSHARIVAGSSTSMSLASLPDPHRKPREDFPLCVSQACSPGPTFPWSTSWRSFGCRDGIVRCGKTIGGKERVCAESMPSRFSRGRFSRPKSVSTWEPRRRYQKRFSGDGC